MNSEYNIVCHMKTEGILSSIKSKKIIKTFRLVIADAMEEKEADLATGNKNLDVKDDEAKFEKAMSETTYINGDHFGTWRKI